MLANRNTCILAAFVSAAVLVTSSPVSAQDEEEGKPTSSVETKSASTPARRTFRPGDIQKVFVLQHANPRVLAELLQVFPATITFSSYGSLPQPAIGVSAPPAVMAAVEETIKRLDVAPPRPRSVEVVGYVVEALATPSTSVPADLEPVVTQLRKTFSYAGYRLLDTVITRGSEGSSLNVSGRSGSEPQGDRSRDYYRVRASRIEVVPGEGGPTMRLLGLDFEAQVPITPVAASAAGASPNQNLIAFFHGDVDMRAGQKVIVGKSGPGDPSRAIFLVLSAKVED